MQRVSSNFTVFFKLFIPTVWIVFFTIFTISIFTIDDQSLPFLTSPVFKYPFLAGYLIFFALIYFTIIQLKRVELGPDFYYVSNYLKTYKLVYEDIASVNIFSLGRLMIVSFRLKASGSFGNKIVFLASKQLYEMFMTSYPTVASHLKDITE
ncbi:MAG TPA: hypothetical protein PKD16_09760 [Saprospiraceae bacterium]|nr:hypothetical protein [Saprospiraceae bacterium]HMT70434.1 hypothetical protein [Saprospiraceae bacterium]